MISGGVGSGWPDDRCRPAWACPRWHAGAARARSIDRQAAIDPLRRAVSSAEMEKAFCFSERTTARRPSRGGHRLLRKWRPSLTLATSAVAITGPTPGSVARHRLAASSRQIATRRTSKSFDPGLQLPQLVEEAREQLTRQIGQRRSRHRIRPFGCQPSRPLGQNDPVFGQQAACLVDQGRALADQDAPRSDAVPGDPAAPSSSPAQSACRGRLAASKIASASTASFLAPRTNGLTKRGWIRRT